MIPASFACSGPTWSGMPYLAGIFGINFEWMPELTWPWGYPAVLTLMLGVSIGLLLWFRRRGWLVGE